MPIKNEPGIGSSTGKFLLEFGISWVLAIGLRFIPDSLGQIAVFNAKQFAP